MSHIISMSNNWWWSEKDLKELCSMSGRVLRFDRRLQAESYHSVRCYIDDDDDRSWWNWRRRKKILCIRFLRTTWVQTNWAVHTEFEPSTQSSALSGWYQDSFSCELICNLERILRCVESRWWDRWRSRVQVPIFYRREIHLHISFHRNERICHSHETILAWIHPRTCDLDMKDHKYLIASDIRLNHWIKMSENTKHTQIVFSCPLVRCLTLSRQENSLRRDPNKRRSQRSHLAEVKWKENKKKVLRCE